MKKDIFEQETESILALTSWENKNKMLSAGFTTRNGGTSKDGYSTLNLGLHVRDRLESVISNREIVGRDLDVSLDKWICSEQTHGANIVKVTKSHCGLGTKSYDTAIKDTDGIYTDTPDILLCSFYADCVPLYFYTENTHFVGLAHAGWKGTVADIAGKMIDALVSEGVSIGDIHVAIGPSISECCYQVDDRVIDGVNQLVNNSLEKMYREVSPGQYRINLKKVNHQRLLDKGILENNILESQFCTSCETDLFFSHRRDGMNAGRMMSYIMLRSE